MTFRLLVLISVVNILISAVIRDLTTVPGIRLPTRYPSGYVTLFIYY